MKSNYLVSLLLHILVFATFFISRPLKRDFEGYPTVIPFEIVKMEPVSFQAPEVQKVVPKKPEVKKPEPKKLAGVTEEKPKVVEEKPEEPPPEPVVEEKEPEENKSLNQNEDLKLDVDDFPFSYYLAIMKSRIEANWEPPVTSRTTISKKTLVYFRVERSGRLTDINIVESSGDFLYDRAAQRAATLANPLPPLPYDFPKESLGVQFAFRQGD